MLRRVKRWMPYLVIVAGLALILLAYAANFKITEFGSMDETSPDTTTRQADGSEIFSFAAEDYGVMQKDIVFFTNHQLVWAYADGKPIYENTETGGIWGRTTGSHWNFVAVPYGTKEIKIKLTPVYQNVRYQDCTFYTGKEQEAFYKIFAQSVITFFVSALIVILGFGMIVYWCIVHRKAEIGNSLLHLGMFSAIFGVWSANETDAMMLIVRDRIAASFMAYILLMLMGIPFILFVRDFLNIGDRKLWKVLFAINVCEMVFVLGFQFFGIADMKETLWLTHMMLCIALFYMIGCLLYKAFRHQIDRHAKISTVGMILLSAATVTDIVLYYRHIGDADLFGRFVFLAFVLMLGYEAAFYAVDTIEKGRKAKVYEELAIHDVLTGLYNRNAYMEDMSQMKSARGKMFVSFDLNNLKECNDGHGHVEGDTYLRNAARIIEKIFDPYGKVYRIGGDEFCCIVEHAARCPILFCIEGMRTEEEKYNSNPEHYPIHIACGYAQFDPERDESFEGTRNRSDVSMYENKSNIKQKMHIEDSRR